MGGRDLHREQVENPSPWPPKRDSSVTAGRGTVEMGTGETTQAFAYLGFDLLPPPHAGQGIVPRARPPSPCTEAPPGGPRQILPGGNVPKALGRDSRVPTAGMLLPSLLRPDTGGDQGEKRTLVPAPPASPHSSSTCL